MPDASRGFRGHLATLAVGLLGVVVGAGLVALMADDSDDAGGEEVAEALVAAVDPDLFQAVTLVNEQTFFGHLGRRDGVLVLDDVFQLTPATETEPGGALVSRRSVSFGPLGPMVIAPSEVAFVEDVGPDSELARGIRDLLRR